MEFGHDSNGNDNLSSGRIRIREVMEISFGCF